MTREEFIIYSVNECKHLLNDIEEEYVHQSGIRKDFTTLPLRIGASKMVEEVNEKLKHINYLLYGI